jgi:hypothetical protein
MKLIKSMEMSPFWEADSPSATKKISQHFMETEGSLPCSQEAYIGPCTEPD